ncbi:CRISPR-associated endonuclease Cas2 [Eubacteriales bacterium OttesenSCG-928-A19]|nr:CRISPR-associated endonuclease Cas2 [Eubacteriales bacterium OttesenSCG-928-A19]
MICMVAYDLSDAALERRVVKTLRRYGMRYQYSIFVCHISRKERAELTKALAQLYTIYKRDKAGEDTVFRISILPLCETCTTMREEIGDALGWPVGSMVIP